MSYRKCEVCQAIIGEDTPDGFIVRSECHRDILVKGVLDIKCKNNHRNLVTTNGENIAP